MWTTRCDGFQLDCYRLLSGWYGFDADFHAKGRGLSARIAPVAAAKFKRFNSDTSSVNEDTMHVEKGIDTDTYVLRTRCIGGAMGDLAMLTSSQDQAPQKNKRELLPLPCCVSLASDVNMVKNNKTPATTAPFWRSERWTWSRRARD